MVVKQEFTEVPSGENLMKVILKVLLFNKLRAKKFEVCEGCELDCPGQRDHMGVNGCLDPESTVNEMYAEECLQNLSAYQMSFIFNLCRSEMRAKPILSLQLAKVVKEEAKIEDLTKDFCKDTTEFVPNLWSNCEEGALIRLCNWVKSEFGMF